MSGHDSCTTGATALSTAGARGELPGRSARGHGVASPCGSLGGVSECLKGIWICELVFGRTVVLDLLVVLDRLHQCISTSIL